MLPMGLDHQIVQLGCLNTVPTSVPRLTAPAVGPKIAGSAGIAQLVERRIRNA